MTPPRWPQKPRRGDYQNLFRGSDGLIRYDRLIGSKRDLVTKKRIGGRRFRATFPTTDWSEAVRARDAYEAKKGLDPRRRGVRLAVVPTFDDAAAEYLKGSGARLARTTREDRTKALTRPEPESTKTWRTPILDRLGSMRLDEITAATLHEFYDAEVTARGRSRRTGENLIDTIAAVLRFARERGRIARGHDPAGDFRTERKEVRTKADRAETDPSENAHPIEEPGDVARVVAQAGAEGAVDHLLVLLMLDAGLRLGEALALRWGDVFPDGGRKRHLWIRVSRPRGGPQEPPKSGRKRKVGLSLRLAAAIAAYRQELIEASLAAGAPTDVDPEAPIVGWVDEDGAYQTIDPNNWRRRAWRRICKRAGVGHRAPKDLRDTFASHLLTSGVTLAYVSKQLGHGSVAVTERHYAKWIPDDADYVEPARFGPDELPADLFARFEVPRRVPQALQLTEVSGGVSEGT